MIMTEQEKYYKRLNDKMDREIIEASKKKEDQCMNACIGVGISFAFILIVLFLMSIRQL